jgi:CheY-like chemotaxis protein
LTRFPAERQPCKNFYVDDDNAVRMTLRLLLEGAGHIVVAAGDGRRGLDLLNGEAFDLLILDIFMPGMGGFETLRLVRQKASLPIIAISGRPNPRRSGRRTGLSGHGQEAWCDQEPAQAFPAGRSFGDSCGLS